MPETQETAEDLFPHSKFNYELCALVVLTLACVAAWGTGYVWTGVTTSLSLLNIDVKINLILTLSLLGALFALYLVVYLFLSSNMRQLLGNLTRIVVANQQSIDYYPDGVYESNEQKNFLMRTLVLLMFALFWIGWYQVASYGSYLSTPTIYNVWVTSGTVPTASYRLFGVGSMFALAVPIAGLIGISGFANYTQRKFYAATMVTKSD